MNRYFKVVYYTTGEEFETSEFYINEPMFRKIQKSIVDGSEFLVFEDKIIKRKMVKEILPADKYIRELEKMGASHLLGLPKNPQLEEKSRKGDYLDKFIK